MFNKIIVWFLGHLHSKFFTGLLPDTRSPQEQQKDFLHEERVFPQAQDPFGNQRISVSPFQYENQFSTSSCVPHGVGLALAIERKNDTGVFASLAPIFPYRLRSNYPSPGSVPSEIFKLYAKNGAPLLTTLPTPQTEFAANNVILTGQMYNEAAIFKGKEFYMIHQGVNDINVLANIAQQNHGVAITIFATYDEWAQSTPQIYAPNLIQNNAEVNHEVCVLPNSGFTVNGVKYVTIQDSAWYGGNQLRYLSENFISLRVTSAGYWDTVQTLGSGPYPQHVFTQNLKVGSQGDEVKFLQQLLIAEGCLPNDCSTGYFGGKTLAGLHAFQEKYMSEILTPLGLTQPTDMFGPASITKANALCV